jgi:molybdenum cofactor biosynthesis enzyme
MVDVGDKEDTLRVAKASGIVLLGREAFELVRDNKMGKGDVLTTAKLAGEAHQFWQLIGTCMAHA